MKNKNLEGWLFNWNPHKEEWRAVNRDHYTELFNTNKSPLVLRSSRLETLIDIVNRTGGDKNKIDKLINNGV